MNFHGAKVRNSQFVSRNDLRMFLQNKLNAEDQKVKGKNKMDKDAASEKERLWLDWQRELADERRVDILCVQLSRVNKGEARSLGDGLKLVYNGANRRGNGLYWLDWQTKLERKCTNDWRECVEGFVMKENKRERQMDGS